MKKIRQNINRIMLLLGTFILCTMQFSCADFLDVDDYFRNTTQLDSIFQRKELVDQYIRGAASYLPNEGNLWTNAPNPFQGASDENFTSFNDGRHAAIKLLLDEITAFNNEFNNYANYYTGIRKASIVLQRINEVQDISDLDRRDFMGRCYFLRGYYYYQLLLQYGPVPIMSDQAIAVDASVEEMSKERSTYDECIEHICENMKMASDLLYSERASDEISIPTKGAALAVISRVRLYSASPWFNGGSGGLYADWKRKSDGAHFISQNVDNEKWGKAAVAAKRIIDLGLYELYISPRKSDTKALPEVVMNTFNTRPIGQFNPGVIDPFRSYSEVFSGDVSVSMNDEIIYSCRPTQSGKDSPAGIAMPALMGGMNGLNLTQDVADAFYMEDGASYSQPDAAHEAIGVAKSFSGYTLSGNAARMHNNREMRFYVTIGFNHCIWPNASYTGSSNLKNLEVQYYADGNAGPPANFAVDYNHSGYTLKKYVNAEDIITNGSIRPKSFPIFRYAEILLNYAEALNELEGSYSEDGIQVTGRDENEILDAFNQIRYRAGLPGLTTLPGQTQMRDLIKKERRIEFVCEGHRYHDLRRWGDAYAAYNRPVLGMNIKARRAERQAFYTITTLTDDKARRYFDYKNYFYPIPKTALDKNDKLVQNPGW
ncbi:MAG: RagB/SusD family nutrient uptake outer membrane protein [Proteiniphilum sp.]|uniref:RagB/SusD family nutrient uptake outer membrane protein n=1 Tax=Proteiniphilum sp. TaxID=1926877 RepID=UPI002B1F1454|nr:RagB/SusD family nutrient uptake outer membrane protein [Proteiniphilum sp.]MEA5130135.1 RagB/SusD family nutrient uptake outer membrane protein [Proteiniphilum sp.]